jgi:FMN phosphatase YigB (HAD superfamily)
MSQSIAAFFDLDGTLFNGYAWRALKRHHEVHRFKFPTGSSLKSLRVS